MKLRDKVCVVTGAASGIGLFQSDPIGSVFATDGTLLGNFPQALTHLALIRSAFVLELHGEGGSGRLHGAHADRARQHADGAADIGALWAAFTRTPRPAPQARSSAAVLSGATLQKMCGWPDKT